MELKNTTENKKHKKKRKAPSTIVESPKRFKSDVSRKELYRQPTVEELNQLRETEILFNSNLFRLQTEELMKEVEVKEAKLKQVKLWIEGFEKYVMDVAEINFQTSKASKKTKDIANDNPLPELKADQDLSFPLKKPLAVKTYGGFNINASVRADMTVDLAVVVSKASFHEKDYLNSRYLVKRAFYLSFIKRHLQNCELVSSASYTNLNGNNLMPVLKVTPANLKKVTFLVRIVPEVDTFKSTRFTPDKNNVRASYYSSVFSDEIKTETDDFGTPQYNSLILSDVTLEVNDSMRKNLLENLKGATDGLILLNIWLRQRGLNEVLGGFSEDLMYYLLAYLVKNGRVNKHMSSYQVIRNTWAYLASSGWNTDGISFSETDNNSLFHNHFDVVFIDTTGHYNLASSLNLDMYLRIKTEAKLAMSYLDDGKLSSFQVLFMTKMPFYLQYDSIVNITDNEIIDKTWKTIDDKYKIDYLNFKTPLIMKKLVNLLKEGLNDRVLSIFPIFKNDTISLGITLDQFNIYRVVEKGPEAYDPAAKKFREFWGERTELRRFKDGSISEAVYWPCKHIEEKRKIYKYIINYILEAKLNLKNYNIIGHQFDFILQKYTFPAVEEANVNVVKTFDELAKILRSLELPLGISTVQGISDSFCHANAYPPKPTKCKSIKSTTNISGDKLVFNEKLTDFKFMPEYVEPIECLIEMAHNTKWPDNLEAMSHLKAAFYIQISQLLSRQDIISKPRMNYLEVLYEGLIFRLVIFNSKQIGLLKKQRNARGVVLYKDTIESVAEEVKFEVVPKIIGALNGLHSQYPSYGPSAVLSKRWLNSQLIDDGLFPNIIVNLLTAATYLESAPYQQPAVPQLGFLRFLNLLARFDFSIQPIILNFNSDLKREQVDEFECNFQQNRDKFPPLCIVTPYDKFNSYLSQAAPTLLILNRVRNLAMECLSLVETNISKQSLFNASNLFKPNLAGYNVIIELYNKINSKFKQSLEYDSKNETNSKEDMNEKFPIVGFNPVELYLKDLRENYKEFALFFHDSYGGNTITVLWKPDALEEEPFKLTNVQGKKLVNDKLQLNIEAFIDDFYILGNGIVKNIRTQ